MMSVKNCQKRCSFLCQNIFPESCIMTMWQGIFSHPCSPSVLVDKAYTFKKNKVPPVFSVPVLLGFTDYKYCLNDSIWWSLRCRWLGSSHCIMFSGLNIFLNLLPHFVLFMFFYYMTLWAWISIITNNAFVFFFNTWPSEHG